MKAILVIDMPDTCEECPCCYGCYCPHLGREMGLWGIKVGKPVDCPLKPMPMKMRTDEDDIEEDSYFQGWNECLEEIEK